MTQTSSLPIPIPPEVVAFAAEQGVDAYLPGVLEITRKTFPDAALDVVVEDDPEIPDDRHIVVLAREVKLTVDQALEASDQWDRGLFAACPAPLVCVFRLGLSLAP